MLREIGAGFKNLKEVQVKQGVMEGAYCTRS